MPDLTLPRFGIEIEGYVPFELEEELCEKLDDLNCDYGGDGSIRTPDNYKYNDIEIKTPPLNLEEFNKFTRKLERALKKYKVGTNTSCGLHVHTSHPKFFKKEYLKKINYTWLAIEDVLFTIQNAQRMYSGACERYYFDYVRNGGLRKFGNSRRAFKRGGFGYSRNALNFGALGEHGTIECRIHRGTVDVERMRNWVYLVNKFYEYCLNNYKATEVITLLKTPCNDEKVQRVWDLLKLDKKRREYFTKFVNPKLYPRLNDQVKDGMEAKHLNSKIKWYQNRFKLNKPVDWRLRGYTDGTRPQTRAEIAYFELLRAKKKADTKFNRDFYGRGRASLPSVISSY